MYCLRLFVVVYKLVMLMLCWIVYVYKRSLLSLSGLSSYIHKWPEAIFQCETESKGLTNFLV